MQLLYAAGLVATLGAVLLAAWLLGLAGPIVSGPAILVETGPVIDTESARGRDGVLHAHRDLLDSFARQRGQADSDGAAALAAGRSELERAMRELQIALADHPDDRQLNALLAAAYRRESRWAAKLREM